MDQRLLQLYNNELKFMREMGVEFAHSYPKMGGRLGIEKMPCADPYVERLLEGVGDASQLTDTLLEVQTVVLDRFFLRMVGFLVLFFVLLLVSRFVWVRMSTT